MATIASMAIQLTINAKQLDALVPKAATRFQELTARLNGVSENISTFARNAVSNISKLFAAPMAAIERILGAVPGVGAALALIPAGLSAGFEAVTGTFKKASETILELRSKAIRLNTTIEDIQPILTLAGDGAEQASKGLFHMQRTIGEAASGSEEAQKKLAQLGMTYTDLIGLSTGQQFGKIADRINATKSASERAKVGMDIFSKSASELNKIINRGSKGIAAFRAKMEAGGMNFTSGHADMVKRANLALKQFDRTIQAVKMNFAIAFAPIIEAFGKFVGKINLSAKRVQTFFLKLAHWAAAAAVVLKNVFSPLSILNLFTGAIFKDFRKVNAFFAEMKHRIEEAGKVVIKPDLPGNFLKSFAEHAEDLTKKLREQTAAYGRNTMAVELNRLAKERDSAIAGAMPKADMAKAAAEKAAGVTALRNKATALIDRVNKLKNDGFASDRRRIENLNAEIAQTIQAIDDLQRSPVKAEVDSDRQKEVAAAKERAEAIYKEAAAMAAELEALDRITQRAVPALNMYREFKIRQNQLNAAFAAGKIKAEGLAGGMKKIAEALQVAEANKAAELSKQYATAAEQGIAKSEELNRLFQKGLINGELWARGMEKAVMDTHRNNEALNEFGNSTEKFIDRVDELNKRFALGRLGMEQWSRGAERAIIDAHRNNEVLNEFGNTVEKFVWRTNELNERLKLGRINAVQWGRGMAKAVEEAHKNNEMLNELGTPMEKFADKIALANQLLELGAYNWELYSRAVKLATHELMAQHKAEELRMAGSVQFGSQEAFTSIHKNMLNSMGQKSPLQSLQDTIKQQLAIQKKEAKDTNEIARAARAGFIAVGKI